MHSSVMYGQVEHETGNGRRSGFTVRLSGSHNICATQCTTPACFGMLLRLLTVVKTILQSLLFAMQIFSLQGSGMGHIGAAGSPAAFGSKAMRRSGDKMSSIQDPAIDIGPALRRSDSFSSNAGWDSGKAGGRYNKTETRFTGGSAGGGQTVCKREAFYVVEVTSAYAQRMETSLCYMQASQQRVQAGQQSVQHLPAKCVIISCVCSSCMHTVPCSACQWHSMLLHDLAWRRPSLNVIPHGFAFPCLGYTVAVPLPSTAIPTVFLHFWGHIYPALQRPVSVCSTSSISAEFESMMCICRIAPSSLPVQNISGSTGCMKW